MHTYSTRSIAVGGCGLHLARPIAPNHDLTAASSIEAPSSELACAEPLHMPYSAGAHVRPTSAAR